MAKKAQVTSESPVEVAAEAVQLDNAEQVATPTVPAAPAVAAPVEVKDKPRKPKLGDGILYKIGGNSERKGEVRFGQITRVVNDNPDNLVVQFNVQCVWADDFRKKEGVPNYPVAPNNGPYDPNGAPGTWKYAD